MSLRVFELAKELNTPTKELITKISRMGIDASGNFSALTEQQVTQIRKEFLEPASRIKETVVPTQEGNPRRVRRRIISAKRAKEGKKIRESLNLGDAPMQEDVKTREQISEDRELEKKAVDDIENVQIKSTEVEKGEREETSTQINGESTQEISTDAIKSDAENVENKVGASKIVRLERFGKKKSNNDKVKQVEKPKNGVQNSSAKVKKKPDQDSFEIKVEVRQKVSESAPIDKVSKKSKKTDDKVDAKKEVIESESASKPIAKTEDKNTESDKVSKKLKKVGKRKPWTSSDRGGDESAATPGYAQSKGNRSRNKKWVNPRKQNRKKESTGPKHTFNPSKKGLVVGESITVGDLAALIGIKVPNIIKTLMSLDMMATITQAIDGETAALVAAENGIELKVQFHNLEDQFVSADEKEEDLTPRPPVVTIMGHVDHGKTSLLDRIRSEDVSSGEAGGITQHIGAYFVRSSEGEVTFLDTPGHAAFSAMRARGANATDIVILVVAADDGPRPQTVEAIDHAKAADVPIIVAINKCDKPAANPDNTIQRLMEHGLISENFGGDTPMIRVSAKSGDGISDLLEALHLQSEIMELKANPDKLATGVVIESKIDKGRGNTATVLVQSGTIRIGDNYVVGTQFGRVRAMWNDQGKKLKEASPSMPIEIVGLNGLPHSGDVFNVSEDEKKVRQLAEQRALIEKEKAQVAQSKNKMSLENLFSTMGEEDRKTLNLIIKTDVIGSLEALTDSLVELSNEEVEVRIIHGAVGAISSTNVVLAAASSAVIIGFNSRPEPKAKQLSKEEGIDIRLYSVIYEAIDDVKAAIEGMLKPIVREEFLGKAQVLEVFNIPKIGTIAGSKVIEGKVQKDNPVRIIRDNVVIHDGFMYSLKRFKDNVKDVTEGFECGIGIESYKDLRNGDIIESYIRTETAAKLS
ncbi:MAG: translation initiation factor IF-2 [Proteobacteria bacterium]|nr:translation initiation factor IF-2 [Pseudomonadota bacterium]